MTTASAAPSAVSDDASLTKARATSSRGRRPNQRPPLHMIVAFLLPALTLYLVFVLYPIVQSLRYSLYKWNGLEPLTRYVGTANFFQAFRDPLFREAIRHNFVIIGLSLLLQLPFALSLAVLLNQRLRGRALLRTFFFAPYILSEVVTGVVWRQIFRPDGLLDHMLNGSGAHGLVHQWLGDPKVALYSLFFVISWKYFGFHMVLLLAGLQQIPKELGEAASIDGANAWQRFRFVTLPLLSPTLKVSAFLSIIGALQLFDLVWVTTKGGPVNSTATMATYLVDWGFRRNQFGYASAVSIIVFGLSLFIAILYQRVILRGAND
jgi:raffinose/stachyose/melibiose transport system permease protein